MRMKCPYHRLPIPPGETCHRCKCAGLKVVTCELDKIDRVKSTLEQQGHQLDYVASHVVLVFKEKQ